MEWSRSEVLSFIECYRSKAILWDPQHPHHYDKMRKHDAWQELAGEFEIPTEECKKKMTSLLASLRREKGRIKKTKGSGSEEVYTSNWFAFEALEFLLDRNKPRSTVDDSVTIGNNIEIKIEPEGITEYPIESCETTATETAPVREKSQAPRLKKTKRSVYTHKERISTAFSVLRNVTQKNEHPDECKSFGLFVSHKLKSYSRVTRSAVEHYISNILFDADQGRFEAIYRRTEHTYGQEHLQGNSSHSSAPSATRQCNRQPTPQSPQESQDEFFDLLN